MSWNAPHFILFWLDLLDAGWTVEDIVSGYGVKRGTVERLLLL